jgi:hypothetical protein
MAWRQVRMVAVPADSKHPCRLVDWQQPGCSPDLLNQCDLQAHKKEELHVCRVTHRPASEKLASPRHPVIRPAQQNKGFSDLGCSQTIGKTHCDNTEQIMPTKWQHRISLGQTWNTTTVRSPTASQLLSVKEAAVSRADGPKNAMHWLILRTRSTATPRSISASAAGPAMPDATSAAIGGASDTYHR